MGAALAARGVIDGAAANEGRESCNLEAVFVRLRLGRRQPHIAVPLTIEETTPLAGGRQVTSNGGWTVVAIDGVGDLNHLGELMRAAYASDLSPTPRKSPLNHFRNRPVNLGGFNPRVALGGGRISLVPKVSLLAERSTK